MGYKKLNILIGWVVFAIATAVYLMTIESTVSLWDCGEYITAAYKLEVGHPPGAPLFMVLGRLFSFFAAPDSVAVWINALSAFSSSFTILFMFWSLTLLLKKIALKKSGDIEGGEKFAIFSAAAIGSLAYTFSDSFWFSAVEGEVYAMASLFTAVIFWAILKWDEEMAEVQNGQLSLTANPNRWILLILFLLGLAIGVHLLGILVVPAIGYMIYFRVKSEVNLVGILLCGLISVFTLGFIQEGIIPGSVSLASTFEVAFVNSLGLPFFTGTIFFFLMLIGLCILGVYYAQKNKKTILYNAMMGLIFLLIGYGSFAVIVIRSNANTPLDENDPENLVTLHSYLKREQYGSAPILYGNYWNSLRNGEEMTTEGPQLVSREDWKDLSPYYLRRFVIIENEEVVKAFTKKSDAEKWVSDNGGAYTIEEKYYESNSSIRKEAVPTYAQGTFFPRMYSGDSPLHQQGYENWSGYNAADEKGTEIGRDGKRLPTFGENLTYFFRYQVNWMYIRYFMWNFSGRQNDIQGHGDNMRGNWISGINFIDEARLGSQEFAPHYTTNNASHNKFYMLPLILAIVGLIFHIYRAPKDAFVLFLAFLFTGVAILVYLNQKPFEPRERDYAYAGSFYFFAMWIGIGVYAIYDFIASKIKNTNTSAIAATALGAIVPLIMGAQGWDDHDRSGKTSARDLAYNYLQSCEKNGIIFTNGDNDTFPLWYLQEVEGIRTDVRVCNLSLMGTDWYTNQMKMRAYESDPLPIKFREDQILMYAGNTDQVYFLSLLELVSMNASDDIIKKVVEMRVKENKTQAKQALMYFNSRIGSIVSKITTSEPNAIKGIEYLTSTNDSNLSESVLKKYYGTITLFKGVQGGSVQFAEGAASELQTLLEQFETPWSAVDFKEAMAFVRDDHNMVNNEGNRFSFFPSSRFSLKVNKENATKANIISKSEIAKCPSKIVFEFNSERDRYLARDEVMMMDIVANNDWKRGIYFSSSRGSSFSIALLSSGYVKQVGMAYELNPIKEEPIFFNLKKMKKHLLETYTYGDMKNPKVLTDYYARRHTQQYRCNFLLLAEQLLNKGDRKGAISLLDKSLELMPLENVLDFGEVNQIDPMNSLKINSAHTNFMYQGQEVKAKSSGCLHEYVQLYFMAGEKAKATKLGMKLADNYETIFNYFEHSAAEYAGNPENAEDLYAALDGCFKMYVIANDPQYLERISLNNESVRMKYGDKTKAISDLVSKFGPEDISKIQKNKFWEGKINGNTIRLELKDFKIDIVDRTLANRLYKLFNKVYKNDMPRIYNELQQAASDAGESAASITGSNYYMSMIAGLQTNLGAMGEHYGFLKSSGTPKPVQSDQEVLDLENLMKEDTITDTLK